MFSGLFFVSAICAHENRIAPVLPFGNISFIYPHPVRLIISAPSRPQLGAWRAFGPRPCLCPSGEKPPTNRILAGCLSDCPLTLD